LIIRNIFIKQKETDPKGEDSDTKKSQNFKKSDFTIAMDSMRDGFEMFIQKSADALFDLGKNIKNFFTSKKKKKENNKNAHKTVKPITTRRKTTAEQQYELSQKIYLEHKKLEEQLEKIDASLTKTQELAGQIKETHRR